MDPIGLCFRRVPSGDKEISGVESKILIKYKRIKWNSSRKASLLLPGGISAYTFSNPNLIP